MPENHIGEVSLLLHTKIEPARLEVLSDNESSLKYSILLKAHQAK